MGCSQSADKGLQYVDDSVHVMLSHDKKVQQRKGEKPHGYVPRAAHPLMETPEDEPGAPSSASAGDGEQ